VKFETTPAFDSAVRRLKPKHAAEFRKVVREKFVPACVSGKVLDTLSNPVSNRSQTVRGEDKSPNQTKENRI
jgi:hypothetical protein